VRQGILALLLVASALSARAHDTWIQPRASRLAPGAPLVVDMTSGMGFPALEHAPEPERLATAKLRVQGRVLDIEQKARGAQALVLTARPSPGGIAAVFVSTRPLTLTLDESQVGEYLEEIGADESVGREWRERAAPRTWRETYRKHAKCFVRLGDTPDASWTEPVGLPLELVPESDPTALRSGAALTLRVLRRGQPLAGFPVAAVAAGVARRLVRTGPDGRATLRLERKGAWLLAGTELWRNGDAWESDFTTLTVDVQP
jgi:uncharacterized GH25 family protein